MASVLIKYNAPPFSGLVSVIVAVDPDYGFDVAIDPNKAKVTTLYNMYNPPKKEEETPAYPCIVRSYLGAVLVPLEKEMMTPNERIARLALATRQFVNRMMHVPIQYVDVQIMY